MGSTLRRRRRWQRVRGRDNGLEVKTAPHSNYTADLSHITLNLFYKGQAIFQPVMSLNFFSQSSSLVPSLSPIISNLESLSLKLISTV